MAIKLSEIGNSGPDQAVSPVSGPSLAETCGRAAESMAQARLALDGELLDPGQALAHLDNAIMCLQSLSGRATGPNAAVESSVVAFQQPKDRRSA